MSARIKEVVLFLGDSVRIVSAAGPYLLRYTSAGVTLKPEVKQEPAPPPENPSWFVGDLIETISCSHCLTVEEVLHGGTATHLVEARREIALALRGRGWSYPRIGKALGGRHHTTILSLLRKPVAKISTVFSQKNSQDFHRQK